MKKWWIIAVTLGLAAVAGLVYNSAFAGQRLRLSQFGSVSQTVNTTEITVTYSRPVARGRDLFGALVPWDEVWNPGANEATWVSFSKDVRIAGQALPAGNYSLWAIPTPDEWTLIFSSDWDVFHIPYPEGEDALRMTVSPVEGSHMEVLAFYFPEVGPASATLVLHWGTTVLPIPIEVEMELI